MLHIASCLGKFIYNVNEKWANVSVNKKIVRFIPSRNIAVNDRGWLVRLYSIGTNIHTFKNGLKKLLTSRSMMILVKICTNYLF